MQGREQRTFIEGIDFGSVFKFQLIFSALASSLQPVRLTIGLIMVLVLFSGGRVWDSFDAPMQSNLNSQISDEQLNQKRIVAIAESATIFSNTAPPDSQDWSVNQAQAHLIMVWEEYLFEGTPSDVERMEFEQLYVLLEEVRPRGVFEASALYIADHWNNLIGGALDIDIALMWKSIVAIVWEYPQLIWESGHHWFISLYGLLFALTLCVGGGAISRMQACQHAGKVQLSLEESLRYACSRWRVSLLALIGPAMLVAIFSMVLIISGFLLLSIPVLNLLGGVLYGLALSLGLLIALIAIFYVATFPMLVPAVMVENCGGGESVQRSFAYLISRTLQYFIYVIMLVVAMILGYLLVKIIATLTLDLTAGLFGTLALNNSLHSAGALQEIVVPTVGLSWYENIASVLVSCWETLVHDCMIGWIFSGFFSMGTMLYLLMRNACDGQSTRDIWQEGLVPGTSIPLNDD